MRLARAAAPMTALMLVLVLGAPSPAASEGREEMAAAFERLQAELRDSPFGVQLIVGAFVDAGRIRGDVYAVLDQPFARVARELQRAEAWCDILTLHFNVKSCRPVPSAGPRGAVDLRIATARKHYVPPSGRTPMTYRLDHAASEEDALRVSLIAARGPLGVRDVRIEIRAIALSERESFLHLHYAYSAGLMARLAARTYLATLGRKKVGFSVVGETAEGEPIHVRGQEGAIERNALRYYLAIVSYLETLPVPEAERFEARLARWYGLTERYERQLFEMARDKYLALKRRERADMEIQAFARTARRRR